MTAKTPTHEASVSAAVSEIATDTDTLQLPTPPTRELDLAHPVCLRFMVKDESQATSKALPLRNVVQVLDLTSFTQTIAVFTPTTTKELKLGL
jgi:hypothetical protein